MHVLVPFDLSVASERALEYALTHLCPSEGQTVTVFHISDAGSSGSEAEEAVRSVCEDCETEAEVETVIEDTGSRVYKEKLRGSIRRTAEEKDVDTVVMGHRPKSLLDDVLYDTTADMILEDLETPVLIVP